MACSSARRTERLTCINCTSTTTIGSRVNRGGNYGLDESYEFVSLRLYGTEASRDAGIGARCARIP